MKNGQLRKRHKSLLYPGSSIVGSYHFLGASPIVFYFFEVVTTQKVTIPKIYIFILAITYIIIIILLYPTIWGSEVTNHYNFRYFSRVTLLSFLGGCYKLMSLAEIFITDDQGFRYLLFIRIPMVMLQDGCYVLNMAHVSSDLQVPIF